MTGIARFLLAAALTALLTESTVLASYTYDGLGRRIVADIDGTVTRYYYDGQRVIEERNGAETRVRYHINGSQYTDERVATHTDSSSEFTYYLLKDNFSISGKGNANGSVIEPLAYSSTGDFTGVPPWIATDFDNDADVDGADFLHFQVCGTAPGIAPATGCEDTDLDGDNDVDQDDFAIYQVCFSGPDTSPPPDCVDPAVVPDSGSFVLHGRPVDVLADGHTLLFVRARYYDLKNSRWLQRDPVGFADGPNLYEAFGSNPTVFVDPLGMERNWLQRLYDWVYFEWKMGSDAQEQRERECERKRKAYKRTRMSRQGIYPGIYPTEDDLLIRLTEPAPLFRAPENAIRIDYVSTPEARIETGATNFLDGNLELPAHGCAAWDVSEVVLAFVPEPIAQGTSAGIGVSHGLYHWEHGDQLGGAVRTVFAVIPAGGAIRGARKTLGKNVVFTTQRGIISHSPVLADDATKSAGLTYKTWNQFQAGTRGQFASRAEAAKAWTAYKQASSVTTEAVRSQAAKSQFLKQLAESGTTPKWMNQWLKQGKVPPGYQVDHIKPLSFGGTDLPSNMRLQGIDLHKTHHRYYRPWE